MTFRKLLLAALALFVVAVGWRYRNAEWVQGLIRPPSKPPAIQFDNGSVRQDTAASRPVGTTPASTVPLGKMRKCRKGAEVSYTDGACPAGSREEALGGGTFTVVPAQAAGPAAGPKPGADAGPREPSIREKRMQQILDR